MSKDKEYERAKLFHQSKMPFSKIVGLVRDIDLVYVDKIRELSWLLERWVNYTSASSEDYSKLYKDVDPDDESANLVRMTRDAFTTRYDETRKYLSSIVDFFNSVRPMIVRIKRGEDFEYEVSATSPAVKAIFDKIEKIDELRKKLP
jgi:hypothetical protein